MTTNTIIGQTAGCHECVWTESDQFKARTKAQAHAKEYKHRTWAEVVRAYDYDSEGRAI